MLRAWGKVPEFLQNSLPDVLLVGGEDLREGFHLDLGGRALQATQRRAKRPGQLRQLLHHPRHRAGQHVHIGRFQDAIGQGTGHLPQQHQFPHGGAPSALVDLLDLVGPSDAKQQGAGLRKPRLSFQARQVLGDGLLNLLFPIDRQGGEPCCNGNHMLLIHDDILVVLVLPFHDLPAQLLAAVLAEELRQLIHAVGHDPRIAGLQSSTALLEISLLLLENTAQHVAHPLRNFIFRSIHHHQNTIGIS
mmetsp:Transcript_21912/g.48141  ORF Transcript_21912/g.48141 Transcript_21912/m.48141 type:complete len:247 (+) Transcript_21912:810-1550(+)